MQKTKPITILLILVSHIWLGQMINRVEKHFDIKNEYKTENIIEDFKSFNFSNIWQKTNSESFFGIIDDKHERISIKWIFIFKISDNPFLYHVYGTAEVKHRICEFYGNIRETKVFYDGLNNEYKDKGIRNQSVLINDYESYENKYLKDSSVFKG